MIPIKKGEDPNSYRYMMHPINSQIKGNITSIPNISEICYDIGRSQICLRTWYTFSFSSKVRFDTKTNELQLSGKYDSHQLQESLYEFISLFVSCPTCSNPETTMFIQSNNQLGLQCRACGSSSPVSLKNKIQQKMGSWIVKHLNTEDLQSHELKDEKPIETLDDFVVPGPDQF